MTEEQKASTIEKPTKPQVQFTQEELDCLYNIGVKHLQANYISKALPIFQTIVAENPLNPRYVKALAGCLQSSKDYLSALMSYQLAYVLDQNNTDCFYYSGICLYKLENYRQAKIEFERFLASKFDNPGMLARTKLYLENIAKQPSTPEDNAEE